jgi:predicted oxidoreductase
MGEYGVKTYAGIQDAAVNASNMLNSTAQLEALMTDPNFQSGALAEPVMAAKKIIEVLGGDPANVASMEAFRSVTSRLILDSMGGSLGAGFSEGDRKFVERMQPSLDMSMAGNRMLIGMQNAVAQRKLQIAEFADRYVAENGRIDEKFNQALRRWSQENPLFGNGSANPASYFNR